MKNLITSTALASILIVFVMCNTCFGQQPGKDDNLKLTIGQPVPDIPLGNVYNYNGNEKSLGDFKGKFLILDFWATWCSPCIGAFPKMEYLRQKYGKDLAIVPVTVDEMAKVQNLFNNLKKDKGLDLFSIVGDIEIKKRFNFRFLPHYVWIDRESTYIGDSDHVSEGRIDSLVSGANVTFVKAVPVVKYFDPVNSFFNLNVPITQDGKAMQEEINMERLVVGGNLTRYLPDLNAPWMQENGRVLAVNVGIGKLYAPLIGRILTEGKLFSNFYQFMPDNRIIWEIKDKKLLDYSDKTVNAMMARDEPGWRQFLREHMFSYEFKTADTVDRVKVCKLAVNDLNQKFKSLYNLSAYTEKRKVKCLVLKRTSGIDKVASHQNTASLNDERINKSFYNYQAKGRTFNSFMLQLVALELQFIETPILDETGFAPGKLIDITLEAKMSDWKSVNAALAKYDLTFKEAEREIDMVIITDSRAPFYYTIR
jgi:thiol-disulfide isomerase/thioredoxin